MKTILCLLNLDLIRWICPRPRKLRDTWSRPFCSSWRKAQVVHATVGLALLLGMAASSKAEETEVFHETFSADRGGGAQEIWEVVSGRWTIEEGSLLGDYKEGIYPLIVAGNERWKAFTAECRVRLIEADRKSDDVGLVFWYRDPANYYVLSGYLAGSIWRCQAGRWECLVSNPSGPQPFWDAQSWITLRMECDGSNLQGFINDHPVAQYRKQRPAHGKIGLRCYNPGKARFDEIVVRLDEAALATLEQEREKLREGVEWTPGFWLGTKQDHRPLKIFRDAEYYTPDEVGNIDEITRYLLSVGIPVEPISANELNGLVGGLENCLLILVAHEEDAVPDVLYDPDGDGDVLEHADPTRFPYLGEALSRSDKWYIGPYNRSRPFEWMFHSGTVILYLGNGLPFRITRPGESIIEVSNHPEDKMASWFKPLAHSRWWVPYDCTGPRRQSQWVFPDAQSWGLSPTAGKALIAKTSLDQYGNVYFPIQGVDIEHYGKKDQGYSNIFIRVGSGGFHYLMPCSELAATAANIARVISKAPWNQVGWPSRIVSPDFRAQDIAPGYPYLGRPPLPVFYGDLSTFGEAQLLYSGATTVDYLESTSGVVSYETPDLSRHVIHLVPNGEFRLLYSGRVTHMNAEENTFQWARIITDEGPSPRIRLVASHFLFYQLPILAVYELESIGREPVSNVRMALDFLPSRVRPYALRVAGSEATISSPEDNYHLLIRPLTQNFAGYGASDAVSPRNLEDGKATLLPDHPGGAWDLPAGLDLFFEGGALSPGEKVGFAFVLCPGEDLKQVRRQSGACARWAIGHIASINSQAVLSLSNTDIERQVLRKWAWLVAPGDGTFRIGTPGDAGTAWRWEPWKPWDGNTVVLPEADYAEIQLSRDPAVLPKPPTGDDLPPVPLREDTERGLLMLNPADALRTVRLAYQPVADRVDSGFCGIGDMMLEFDHHWILESPTITPYIWWGILLNDDRYIQLAHNAASQFMGEQLLAPNGDCFRRSELYGLVPDYYPASVTGLRNELSAYRYLRRNEYLQMALRMADFVEHAFPFKTDLPVNRLEIFEGPESYLLSGEGNLFRAENVAAYGNAMLDLFSLTGEQRYLALAEKAAEFLLRYNQRPNGGFCAVFYSTEDSQLTWDNWFGPHTADPCLDFLLSLYETTRNERYLASVGKCLDESLKPFFRTEVSPWEPKEQILSYAWFSEAVLFLRYGEITGKEEYLDFGANLARQAYEYSVVKGHFNRSTGKWNYPEMDLVCPCAGTFLVGMDGRICTLSKTEGEWNLRVQLSDWNYLLALRCPSEPSALWSSRGPVARAESVWDLVNAPVSGGWVWQKGLLVIRFNTEAGEFSAGVKFFE